MGNGSNYSADGREKFSNDSKKRTSTVTGHRGHQNDQLTSSSSTHAEQGSAAYGVNPRRAAEQTQSRSDRAKYAREYPQVQFKDDRHERRDRVMQSVNDLSDPRYAHTYEPRLDIEDEQAHRLGSSSDQNEPSNSQSYYQPRLSAEASTVDLQTHLTTDSAPRSNDTDFSSSIAEDRKPGQNERDQNQVQKGSWNLKEQQTNALETLLPRNDTHFASTITCEWELPMLCGDGIESSESSAETSAFDLQDFLSSFITITGDDNGFQCATALDFVAEKWSEDGQEALRAVSRAAELALFGERRPLSQTEERQIITKDGGTKIQIMRSTAHDVQILIEGSKTAEERCNLAEAVLWICAAIRPIPTESPSHNEGIFKSLTSQVAASNTVDCSFHFTLEPLGMWSPNAPDESTCWMKLFKSAVVAWRPLRRQWGKGIEMSFDMMVDLAAVENYYLLNGGMVLLGYKTALTPVDWNKENNSFQWHFEIMESSRPGVIRPSSLKATQTEWMKLQTSSEFQGARCFVGWFEKAYVMLGTHELLDRHQQSSWSGSEPYPETLRQEGIENAAQLGLNIAPINFGLQGVRTYRQLSTVQRFSHSESYTTALIECQRKVALVIDSFTKQAWLVPYLSLVLHLCHRYFQNFTTENTTSNPLPFAKPTCNGHKAALDAMLDQETIVVLGQTLGQLVHRIHLGFELASELRENPKRGSIFATELMSIFESSMMGTPLSKVNVSDPRSVAGSWQKIVKNVDVIGIYKDLGVAIKPDFPAGSVCPNCSTLPEGGFYLAAHMRCLDALAFRGRDGTIDKILEGSCSLGDNKTVWQSSEHLWIKCNGPEHVPIWDKNPPWEVLQHISTSKSKKKTCPKSDASVTRDGVVVFGDRYRTQHLVKRLLEDSKDFMQSRRPS